MYGPPIRRPVRVVEPAEVTLLERVLPVRVSVTDTVASVDGIPFGADTFTLKEEVVCCAKAAIGIVKTHRNIRKANEFLILLYIELSTCKNCPPVKRHITLVMIGAIVARIYYKILTIDHVFMIGCAAIYSLCLYVIVDRSVFLFKHLNKVLYDKTIDTY